MKAERLGERLYGAVRWGDLRPVRSLLQAKASVDYRGPKFRNTPLMDAASHGYLSVARVLIAAGADVDACDKFGMSAMHHAAKAGQLPIVRILLAAGAAHSLVNKAGKTPLDLGGTDAAVVVVFEEIGRAHV